MEGSYTASHVNPVPFLQLQPWEETGREAASAEASAKGELAVYMLCGCIQVSAVRLLITLEPFETLNRSGGNSLHCFAV